MEAAGHRARRHFGRGNGDATLPRRDIREGSRRLQISAIASDEVRSPSMLVLRCTQHLLVRLKQFDDLPPVESTTRLGDWYGNTLRMGRRHALIFISERSRLPVLIPIRQADRLKAVLGQWLVVGGVSLETVQPPP